MLRYVAGGHKRMNSTSNKKVVFTRIVGIVSSCSSTCSLTSCRAAPPPAPIGVK